MYCVNHVRLKAFKDLFVDSGEPLLPQLCVSSGYNFKACTDGLSSRLPDENLLIAQRHPDDLKYLRYPLVK